jgi:DNA-binding transcriptional ArsR family regulator
MDLERCAAALANEKRLSILRWLKDPHRQFPPQVHGDKDRDGICGAFIAEKLGVTPATASMHLKVLLLAGLVRSKRKGKFTYYLRDKKTIAALGAQIGRL